jgi:23S rRNA (uracil1939-C5)-methyltransferase/tRNA (uracil-5-)-methyltransferase
VANPKRKFNAHPFAYHQELELEITTLTNLGAGLGRVRLEPADGPALRSPAERGEGWVVMVAFSLPGERVRARVFRNHKNYSEADLLEVVTPSPHRVTPRCPLFGRCGGCQYQNLAYAEQLRWKRQQVRELLLHLADTDFAVAPIIASPRDFGYRSKITPHFHAPTRVKEIPNAKLQIPNNALPSSGTKQSAAFTQNSEPKTQNQGESPFPIGFLRQGSRYEIVDVPRCEIAMQEINRQLGAVRAAVQARILAGEFTRDVTLLLRAAGGVVTTNYDAVITEEIPLAGGPPAADPSPAFVPPAPPLRLRFLARDFFQNNPFLLPAFAGYVRDQAAADGARFLVDAYCGSGLFALAAAARFERVAGVEVSETSVAFARENAAANGIINATFLAGAAATIFAGLNFPPGDTAVVIDPPRKGCDEAFLGQLLGFGPRTVVYVSCDPATQMRDLRRFMAAGYALAAVQPFDLFPQTRHLECVITLRKTA